MKKIHPFPALAPSPNDPPKSSIDFELTPEIQELMDLYLKDTDVVADRLEAFFVAMHSEEWKFSPAAIADDAREVRELIGARHQALAAVLNACIAAGKAGA